MALIRPFHLKRSHFTKGDLYKKTVAKVTFNSTLLNRYGLVSNAFKLVKV